MMLARQVFFRQAYFKQVYMGALKPSDIAEALQINHRFGLLMREERKAAGYALDKVAQDFGLTLRDLYDWELGLTSPPAKLFYALMKHYGPAAFHRAAELDMEIQMEKYNILVAAKNGFAPVDAPPTSHSSALTA